LIQVPLPPLELTIELENPEALQDPPMELFQRAMQRGTMLAAETAKAIWMDVAVNQFHLRTEGNYLRGIESEGNIRVVKAPTSTGAQFEMVVEIVNTDPQASIIEEGHAAFSLPRKIDWGRTDGSIKTGKKGNKYLHIPFKHRAYASETVRTQAGYLPASRKAMMPAEIYDQAKALVFTKADRVGPIYNKRGQFVAADRYNWEKGQRRLKRVAGHTGYKRSKTGEWYEERRGEQRVGRDKHGDLVNPEWKSSRYAGMIRANTAGQTEYFTIRTLTPDSPGWNIPARPGLFIAQRVASILGNNRGVQEALVQGVNEVLGGAL